MQSLDLFEGRLEHLEIDLERWGCDTIVSYKYLTDYTLGEIAKYLSNLKSI